MKNQINLYVILLVTVSLLFACEQEGGSVIPSLEFPVETLHAAKDSSAYEIEISSNLPWKVKSQNDWILIEHETLDGDANDKMIKIHVLENTNPVEREGTITAYINTRNAKIFTVIQAAGDPISENVLYVKMQGTGDGTTWDKATTLSKALQKPLKQGDTIFVAAGTYMPEDIITNGSDGEEGDKTFEIKTNLTLIGGFPPNATKGAVSNPAMYETILDGNQSSYHVVTVTAPIIEGEKVRLEGLTIRNGRGSTVTASNTVNVNGSSFPRAQGNGLIMASSIVEMTDCIVTDNESVFHGVGIYVFHADAILTLNRCVLKNNKGTISNGVALYLNPGTAYIYDSTIKDNESLTGGGAAMQLYSTATNAPVKVFMYNSTIVNNRVGGHCGAVYVRNNSTAEIVNCTFYGNVSSNNEAGAIRTHHSGVCNLISSTITNNSSGTGKRAGGIGNSAGCTLNLYNTIVSGNFKADGEFDDIANFGTLTQKNTVVGSIAFDATGAEIPGVAFEPSIMLGALSDNGGDTQTCRLLGTNNPAENYGMSVTELSQLGATFTPAIPNAIITFDQTGKNRSGKRCMGSVCN